MADFCIVQHASANPPLGPKWMLYTYACNMAPQALLQQRKSLLHRPLRLAKSVMGETSKSPLLSNFSPAGIQKCAYPCEHTFGAQCRMGQDMGVIWNRERVAVKVAPLFHLCSFSSHSSGSGFSSFKKTRGGVGNVLCACICSICVALRFPACFGYCTSFPCDWRAFPCTLRRQLPSQGSFWLLAGVHCGSLMAVPFLRVCWLPVKVQGENTASREFLGGQLPFPPPHEHLMHCLLSVTVMRWALLHLNSSGKPRDPTSLHHATDQLPWDWGSGREALTFCCLQSCKKKKTGRGRQGEEQKRSVCLHEHL